MASKEHASQELKLVLQIDGRPRSCRLSKRKGEVCSPTKHALLRVSHRIILCISENFIGHEFFGMPSFSEVVLGLDEVCINLHKSIDAGNVSTRVLTQEAGFQMAAVCSRAHADLASFKVFTA